MVHTERTRIAPRAGLLLAIAAIAGLGGAWRAASPSKDSSTRAARAPIHVPARERPGVARLDPDLLGALRRAAAAAAADGIRLYVDSGWRSPEHQERLLREAISKYGSEAAATRWVATPKTSAHVKGEAVDIGPPAAAAWLSEHGAAYGLCQIYANEPWHYELRPEAITGGCPATYPDPTSDPRMHP